MKKPEDYSSGFNSRSSFSLTALFKSKPSPSPNNLYHKAGRNGVGYDHYKGDW